MNTTPKIQVWSNEDGDLFAHGHVEPVAFIEAAKRFWMDTTGDMDQWEDHYADIGPEWIGHGWWLPASDDPDEERGKWHEEEVPGSEPFTIHWT